MPCCFTLEQDVQSPSLDIAGHAHWRSHTIAYHPITRARYISISVKDFVSLTSSTSRGVSATHCQVETTSIRVGSWSSSFSLRRLRFITSARGSLFLVFFSFQLSSTWHLQRVQPILRPNGQAIFGQQKSFGK